jgi:iron complex transport system permease protein
MEPLEKRTRTVLTFFLLGIVLFLCIVFALMVGPLGPIGASVPGSMTFGSFFQALLGGGSNANGIDLGVIIYEIRMPRVLLSVLVGGGLAVAGALMQGLFKNPMALHTGNLLGRSPRGIHCHLIRVRLRA